MRFVHSTACASRPVDDASGAKVVLRTKVVGVIAVVEKVVYVVESRKEVG